MRNNKALALALLASFLGSHSLFAEEKKSNPVVSTCRMILSIGKETFSTSARDIYGFSKVVGRFAISPVKSSKEFYRAATTPVGESKHSLLYYTTVVGPLFDAARDPNRRRGALIDLPLNSAPINAVGGLIASGTMALLHGHLPSSLVSERYVSETAKAWGSFVGAQASRFSLYADKAISTDTQRFAGRLTGVFSYMALEFAANPSFVTGASMAAYVGFFWSPFSQKVTQEYIKPRVVDSQPDAFQMRALRDDRFALSDILSGNSEKAQESERTLQELKAKKQLILDSLPMEGGNPSALVKAYKKSLKEVNKEITSKKSDLAVYKGGHAAKIEHQKALVAFLEVEVARLSALKPVAQESGVDLAEQAKGLKQSLGSERKTMFAMIRKRASDAEKQSQEKKIAAILEELNATEEKVYPQKILRTKQVELDVARAVLKSYGKVNERIPKYFDMLRSSGDSKHSRFARRAALEARWFAVNLPGQSIGLITLPMYLIYKWFMVGSDDKNGPLRALFQGMEDGLKWLFAKSVGSFDDARDQLSDAVQTDDSMSEQDRQSAQEYIDAVDFLKADPEIQSMIQVEQGA